MKKKIFEPIPHTADIKIRVYGENFEELFCNALKGMFLSIGPMNKQYGLITIDNIPERLDRHHTIEVSAPNVELLLIDFLSEALYLSDVHNEAYFNIIFDSFRQTKTKGTIVGTSIEKFEVVEIKAVTYHDLKIERINSQIQAQIVFDI